MNDASIAVQVPADTFIELALFLREMGDFRDPSEIIGVAIESWLVHAKGAGRLQSKKRSDAQWKSLFLPDATELRMQYHGQCFYARVSGDAITYDGRSLSPRQFVNFIAGNSRNAWRDLWIRFPGTKAWRCADAMRRDLKRMAEDSAQPSASRVPTSASADRLAAGLRNTLAMIEEAKAARRG